jgi:hypothetical protein
MFGLLMTDGGQWGIGDTTAEASMTDIKGVVL